MFRPAEDQLERMAAYEMKRGAVHDMGMMLRMEEQQMLMMQMQEMEMMQMMQMQAMGCIPSCAGAQWASPLEQPQLMMQESPSPQQQDTDSVMNFCGPETAAAPTRSSSTQPPATRAGQVSTSLPSAAKLVINGGVTSTSPSATTARRGVGFSDASSKPGDSSAYAPNSLYNTMASVTDAKEPFVAQESMYNGSSMYAGNMSASAPALTGGGLNEGGASTAGYSMYAANSASSMYEQQAPSSAAAVPSATLTARPAGARVSGNSSKVATAVPQRQRPASGVSPALQRKSSANVNGSDTASTTTHRSREIRQKNSELKRQSLSRTVGCGSRSSSICSASAEKKLSSSADKNERSSSSSCPKGNGKRRSPSTSSSSSAKQRDRKRH
ncbi:hypothetical protein LSCM1_01517 [Leishmania martiniquensis]|uniref:Uncharacterized protein n=1 Tax=Leishmania martiniquensis TaxID=1580590 RepID=A0A836GFY0_9TRYP|nr:hypothetical protein LSCM1_01517 [Leishmania martiniquensis]